MGSMHRPACMALGLLGASCSVEVLDEVPASADESTGGALLMERAEDGEVSVSAGIWRTTTGSAEFAALLVAPDVEAFGGRGCDVLRSTPGLVGEVQMLDVGNIEVRVGHSRTTLKPRAFPTVGSRVSGVVYTSGAANPEALMDGLGDDHRVSVHIDDPGVLGRSGWEFSRPAPLGQVSVGVDGGESFVAWGTPVPGAAILVSFAANGSAHQCVFDDTGEAVIARAPIDDVVVSRLVRVRSEVAPDEPAFQGFWLEQRIPSP